MAARCTTPAAAMHHFGGMGAPFQRWPCTIICGQAALLERRTQVSTYFSWQRKVFQALKEVREVTFAEVPVMEHSQLSGHIVAAMEVSGVQIQVYEGADEATLQAILQAAKSC